MSQQEIDAREFGPGPDDDEAQRKGRFGLARRGWRAWKRIARRAGNLQARGIFNLAFFLLIAPIALATRILNRRGDSAIRHRSGGWQPHPAAEDDPMASSRRQS
jgi:hypothetical protein